MEESRLLSLYLTIFFYRLDKAIDESSYFKENPQEKSRVFQIFNDFLTSSISPEEFNLKLKNIPNIETHLIFLVHEIKALIPKNEK